MLANHKLQKCYGNVQDGEFLTSNKFTFSTQRQNSSVNFNPRHATKEEVDANRLTANSAHVASLFTVSSWDGE